MDKDTITSLLNSTGSDTTSQITQFLQPLLIISTLLTIVIIIVYIYNSIQKRRINQAILRIDKNVQILIDRGDKSEAIQAIAKQPPTAEEGIQE